VKLTRSLIAVISLSLTALPSFGQSLEFPVGDATRDPLTCDSPDSFGPDRFCITTRWNGARQGDSAPHTGVDLTNNLEGNVVRSIGVGVVVLSLTEAQSAGFGNVIMIRHDDLTDGTFHFYSIYAHLKNNSIQEYGVYEGKPVGRGEPIARVDCTGETESDTGAACESNGRPGPHLHFAIRKLPKDEPPSLGCGYLSTRCNSDRGINLRDRYEDPISFIRDHLASSPTPSFDFAMAFLSIDGNILKRGNADGLSDFIDNFSDGSLTTFPTAAFFFPQGVDKTLERAGFLRFESADGYQTASRFGFTYIEDDAFLNNFPLVNGGGSAVITASFRADKPAPNQFYGIGVRNFGLAILESCVITVGNGSDGEPRVRVNDHTGTFIAVDRVALPEGGSVLLRLSVDDSAQQIIASYSVDNGVTFKQANNFGFFLRHGTIFNATSTARIFAQGGIRVAQ
jgi:hypothetical protein